MDLSHIKHQVIAPSLQAIGLYSDTALNLVTGTGLAESGYITTVQYGGGPAIGWFQMEPFTYNDCWDNYLRYRTVLSREILGLIPHSLGSYPPVVSALVDYPQYAAAMCRVKYYRSFITLPQNTPESLCRYWSNVYNTSLGKGTADNAHISLFAQAITA